MRRLRRHGDHRQRGQGLVEFTLVLPILIVLIVSVGELGLIFGKMHSLGYASREGARAGAALARGDKSLCVSGALDPSLVDASLVGAMQRILTSPDSGIDLGKVQEIRIFRALPTGREDGGFVNRWTHVGLGNGPEIDPGPGTIRIAFAPSGTSPWPACSRQNPASNGLYDSLGVTIRYTYDFVTPLPAILNALSGGALTLTLSETTVMALNPTL